jgi:hypothetical protein
VGASAVAFNINNIHVEGGSGYITDNIMDTAPSGNTTAWVISGTTPNP